MLTDLRRCNRFPKDGAFSTSVSSSHFMCENKLNMDGIIFGELVFTFLNEPRAGSNLGEH